MKFELPQLILINWFWPHKKPEWNHEVQGLFQPGALDMFIIIQICLLRFFNYATYTQRTTQQQQQQQQQQKTLNKTK